MDERTQPNTTREVDDFCSADERAGKLLLLKNSVNETFVALKTFGKFG